MAKSLFDTMSRFKTSLVTPFCSILLILPLHRLFKQLGLILRDIYEGKDVKHDQSKILAKHFFDTMSRFGL